MKMIRLKGVMDMTGLGRSTVYACIAQGKFPKPVKLSDRCVGFLLSEVEDWILARIEERDAH